MMRNDINIALVSMVRQKPTDNTSIALNVSLNGNVSEALTPQTDDFDWSTLVQSMITSSFYACYVLSQVKYTLFFQKSINYQINTNTY